MRGRARAGVAPKLTNRSNLERERESQKLTQRNSSQTPRERGRREIDRLRGRREPSKNKIFPLSNLARGSQERERTHTQKCQISLQTNAPSLQIPIRSSLNSIMEWRLVPRRWIDPPTVARFSAPPRSSGDKGWETSHLTTSRGREAISPFV